MKFAITFILAAVWCAMSVFVIRHHRRKPESFQKTTLGEIYFDFFKEIPRLLDPRRQGLLLLGLTAIFSSFYPMVAVVGVRAGGGRGLFLVGGVVALVGSAVNVILIVLSHTSFMFGSSSKCKEETVLTWLLPLSQATFAMASVVIGFSAGWVSSFCSFISQ